MLISELKALFKSDAFASLSVPEKAELNKLYVRKLVENRGWTEEIEKLAMLYVSVGEAYQQGLAEGSHTCLGSL